MNTERDRRLVESFVKTMSEGIRFYSNGMLSECEIKYLAEYEVNRLDFQNKWQMHKGIGYFAKRAVKRFLDEKE